MQRFPDLAAHLVGAGKVKAVAGPALGGQALRVDLTGKVKSVTRVAQLDSHGYALADAVGPRYRVWLPALAAAGLAEVHVHDLRHTGNQFTAAAGANPRELMARMGHDSPRAALIYLHSSAERQRTLAEAVGKAARAELAKSKKRTAAKPSGTRKARKPR